MVRKRHSDEDCLNAYWFVWLADAREKLEHWRRYYGAERPHVAIGNNVPITLMKSADATSPSAVRNAQNPNALTPDEDALGSTPVHAHPLRTKSCSRLQAPWQRPLASAQNELSCDGSTADIGPEGRIEPPRSLFIGVIAIEGNLVAEVVTKISNIEVLAVFVTESRCTLIRSSGFTSCRMKITDQLLRINLEGKHRAVSECGSTSIIGLPDIDSARTIGKRIHGYAGRLRTLVTERAKDGGIEAFGTADIIRTDYDVAEHGTLHSS